MDAFLALLKQVLTSWQVPFITVVVILYITLVSHVAKSRRKIRVSRQAKPKTRPKPKKDAKEAQDAEESEGPGDSMEESPPPEE